VDANTRTRNSFRSIPPIFSLFAAVHLLDWTKLLKQRVSSNRNIGFGSDRPLTAWERDLKASKILKDTAPDDLLKFGLIPEFVGRMPVIAVLESLDEEALVRILVEPKNAILKQYQQLLILDGVELKFDQEAIKAVAEEAIKRKTGARALRAIVEEIMLDIMYEVPSRNDIKAVHITKELVESAPRRSFSSCLTRQSLKERFA